MTIGKEMRGLRYVKETERAGVRTSGQHVRWAKVIVRLWTNAHAVKHKRTIPPGVSSAKVCKPPVLGTRWRVSLNLVPPMAKNPAGRMDRLWILLGAERAQVALKRSPNSTTMMLSISTACVGRACMLAAIKGSKQAVRDGSSPRGATRTKRMQ
jgi:hypothetical protein